MTTSEENLKWLYEFFTTGKYVYKSHRIGHQGNDMYHGHTFAAANVGGYRLYLYNTETFRDGEVNRCEGELSGWPAEYERSPASGKVDYAAITRGIVGR